jgi:hypothetical protein
MVSTEPASASVLMHVIIHRTELELAKAVHGDSGLQQNVNQDCEALARMDRVDRRGVGGPGKPFRYYPKQKPS